MKDKYFYEIIISKDKHRLISADAKAYSIISNDLINGLDEYVDPAFRKQFIEKVDMADGKWFPARIGYGNNRSFYYVRSTPKDNEKMIRLQLADLDEIMAKHDELTHTIGSLEAQLELYEDVFFEYTPSRDTVAVFNTDNARFDSGIYSLGEFEDLLLEKAKGRQREAVKSFVRQIKSGVGRSSTRIDGNIINDDVNVTHTIMDESFVFYGRESEGVVGHIHLGTSKGKNYAASIKHDSLTGLVDKADIIRIAKERIDGRRLSGTTLAIIDIDFFKSINDTYGHQFGDEVIKKISDIISTEVGNDGIAGRFGGDEFLVVFYNIQNEDGLRAKLKSIKNLVSATFPDKGIDMDNPLSVSIGAAGFPNDADNYEDVFMLADYSLYMAKDKGRNRYVIYTMSKHGTLDAIREKRYFSKKINERDQSYGDMIVKMFDLTLHGNPCSVEHLMDEFAEAFEFQHMTLFVGEPFFCRYTTGSDCIKEESARDFVLGILNGEAGKKYLLDDNFIVVNRLDALPPYANSVKNFLSELDVQSYVRIKFSDKDKRECFLIFASIGKKVQWNQTHYKFYRAFADLLSLYSLG
ncbi:MAG: GGDEF domain-containing protein [Butyrivibrio sp.]|nr:GGDEF domain-containing protein [Butyrivibrio sp.]